MINSDDYVGAALCLRAQMRRVGSACPLLLMYDDRSERLSGEAIVRLQGAFDRLVPISELALMVDQWHARVDSTAASRTRDNISVTRPAGGRRLYTSVSQTHAKVYIWALPWERVAYLDLDTLLLANIDDVLRVQLSARESLAATNCTGTGAGTGAGTDRCGRRILLCSRVHGLETECQGDADAGDTHAFRTQPVEGPRARLVGTRSGGPQVRT